MVASGKSNRLITSVTSWRAQVTGVENKEMSWRRQSCQGLCWQCHLVDVWWKGDKTLYWWSWQTKCPPNHNRPRNVKDILFTLSLYEHLYMSSRVGQNWMLHFAQTCFLVSYTQAHGMHACVCVYVLESVHVCAGEVFNTGLGGCSSLGTVYCNMYSIP